jgi:hypothetical protein
MASKDGCQSATKMDEERDRVLASVSQTITGFFMGLDSDDHERCASSFARDGAWERKGVLWTGPSGIRAALAARPTGRVTRHLITNIMVETWRPEARVRFYSLAFSFAAAAENPAAPMVPPLALTTYECRLVNRGPGWLIHHLSSEDHLRSDAQLSST